MTYSEIVERAFTFLYVNNMEYPRVISYPIFKLVKGEGVFDMFFVLKNEGSDLCQENISFTFLCEIGGNRTGFWNASSNATNKDNTMSNICLDYTSLDCKKEESFGELYEKVRSFVFKKDLTAAEKKSALQLARKYEKDLNSELYHMLSYEFFSWVKELEFKNQE